VILCCGRGVQDVRSFSACLVCFTRKRNPKNNSHGLVVAGQRKDAEKHDANVDVALNMATVIFVGSSVDLYAFSVGLEDASA